MKNFRNNLEKFNNEQGNNFGPCLSETHNNHVLIQFRIHRLNGKSYLIMIHPDGEPGGDYTMFAQENAPKAPANGVGAKITHVEKTEWNEMAREILSDRVGRYICADDRNIKTFNFKFGDFTVAVFEGSEDTCNKISHFLFKEGF